MKCPFGVLGSETPPIYHGTTSDREQCILREGFRISTGMETPAAFGKGTYFSTTKRDARIYALAKGRDDIRVGKKRYKACVIEKKFKPDARIVHIDYAPNLSQQRRMETEKPSWLESLLEYFRTTAFKDKITGEIDHELADHYIEKWSKRYNHGLDESERYELAEFAKASGCTAIRWYASIGDKSAGGTSKIIKGYPKYKTNDIILVL